MRGADFNKRLEAAAKIAREVLGIEPEWASDKIASTMINWYDIRSEIAHGDPPTQSFDVPPVIYLANEVAATLDKVTRALPEKTGGKR